MRLTRYLVVFLLLTLSQIVISQNYKSIPTIYNKDSSIYSMNHIDANNWLIGGENGYLKLVNNKGEMLNPPFHIEGGDILKIVSDSNNIYIAGQGPRLSIVNKSTNIVRTFVFDKILKNSCFYDMALMPDNKIVLCGGNHGIAHARKVIPNGFIAVCDLKNPLESFTLLKKSKYRFYFSLLYDIKSKTVLASAFNGAFSVIYSGNGLNKKWTRKHQIKGIVHDMIYDNEGVFWYSGCLGINYNKKGIYGRIDQSGNHKSISKSGFIGGLCELNDVIYASSVSGELISISKKTGEYTTEKTLLNGPIYSIEQFDGNSLLIGGHGKSICIRY